MMTGTRWHAIRRTVPLSIIAGVRARKIEQQKMDRVPLRATGTLVGRTAFHDCSRPWDSETCLKCGETRLPERVDRHRWFCAVCAHSWTSGVRNDGTN
jgi:hypothetical protein